MEKKKVITSVVVTLALLVMSASIVLADTESTTVQFVIPSSVDHSISFGTVGGSGCGTGASDMYFVENDATKDGTQTMINASEDSTGTICQNITISAMTISNDGSVAINVSAYIDTLDAGVVLKTSTNVTGYQSTCDDNVSDGQCVTVGANAGNYTVIAKDIAAQTGTDTVWWWADFSSYNSGVATDGTQRTITTNATDVS